MAGVLHFRKATLKDKQSVLHLRTDLYATEYLQDRFDEYLCDPNRLCIVGQIGEEVAVFVVVLFIDNGKTAFIHSARVRQGWEGRGYYRQALELIDRIATTRNCSRKRFNVRGYDNKFVSSQKFETGYTLKTSQISFIRKTVPGNLHKNIPLSGVELKPVSGETMFEFLSDTKLRQHLFPDGLMAINKAVYSADVSNIRFLFDGCARLYHNVRTEDGIIRGLLSSVSCLSRVLLNVIGQDKSAVEEHIRFHCQRLFQMFMKGVTVELVCDNCINCEIVDVALNTYGLQVVPAGCKTAVDVLVVEKSLM